MSDEYEMRSIFIMDLLHCDGQPHLFIDAYDLMQSEKSQMPFINDCRRDIHEALPTASDLERLNVKFINLVIHGWPYCYLVTCKNIRKKDDLFTFYSKEYGSSVKERERADKKKQQNQKIVEIYSTSKHSPIDLSS